MGPTREKREGQKPVIRIMNGGNVFASYKDKNAIFGKHFNDIWPKLR